jgi:caa(3)-type oxidase subunit IV
MSNAQTHDARKEVRGYIVVFVALAALTALTVAASYLDVSTTMHILIAMGIATVKGGMVAAYFMHLISEKKMIYSTLILTAVFFVILMVVPLSTAMDTIGV